MARRSSKGKARADVKRAGQEPTKHVIDEELMRELVERVYSALDQNASFADFEREALQVGNELVQQVVKKNSKA